MTRLRRSIWPIAILLIASCGDDRPVPGEITLNDAFVLDFNLVDHEGEPATDERFEGEPMLIYFGFASCPDVCPAALSVMTATLDELGRDAAALQPLFITVDPERDTPERLRSHLTFDDRILGLTGSQQAIDETRNGMRVFAKKVAMEDSALGYSVDHQSMFFLTDASGKPVRAFDDGMPPEVMADAIRPWL
jgi:protein SCO1/2